MRNPLRRGEWRIDGEWQVDTMRVAVRLAGLDPVSELGYRGVALEATAVDVTPCRRTAADVFYRFFRLRPLRPGHDAAPVDGLPEEWTSEAISIPRHLRKGVGPGLAKFEAEFALHALLQRVEREIDALQESAARPTARPRAQRTREAARERRSYDPHAPEAYTGSPPP
ncbi:MAG: hypothetical protein BWY94_02281 [Actinobacteria bacterium ADurb.BinA094]|nr:MAG: hypothetical protein BWY94_02281 [Actinobacteria bacterium ADurb.BinA094]